MSKMIHLPKTASLVIILAAMLIVSINFIVNKNNQDVESASSRRQRSPFSDSLPKDPHEFAPRHKQTFSRLIITKTSKLMWPTDKNCSSQQVFYGRKIRRTWLLSFPGSGVSWLRYLLEGATGVLTGGGAESPKQLAASKGSGSPFTGESQNVKSGRTLVQNTQSQEQVLKLPWIRTILLIRCPYSSITSYWKRKKVRNRPSKRRSSVVSQHKDKVFTDFVRSQTAQWRDLHIAVLYNMTDIMPLQYEKLQQDPIAKTRELLDFLRLVPDEGRLVCLGRHLNENPRRNSISNEDDTTFTLSKEQKNTMTKAVQQVNEVLMQKGFNELVGCLDFE